MKNNHQKILIISLILISILEVLAYKYQGVFSFVAGRIWVALGIFYFLTSGYYILKTVKQDVQEKNFFFIISLVSIIFVLFWQINSYMNLNHESTQQVAAFFQNIAKRDFNYTGTSFLGYPSRQYFIVGFFSLVLGKSPLSLNLGYAFQLLFGSLIFYSGLKHFLKKKIKLHNFISSLFFISIFTFPYVLEFAKKYEQAILPLSFTLQAFGLIFYLIDGFDAFKFIDFVWIGTVLATCYTPGLGSWILVLFLIIYYLIKHKQNRPLFLGAFLTILIFGLISLTSRLDLKLVPNENNVQNLKYTVNNLLFGYKMFLFPDQKYFISIPLFVPVFFYLVSSLLFFFGFMHFAISLWVLVIVGVSILLKGYCSPFTDFALHRALITIPPIFFGITVLINQSGRLASLDLDKKYLKVLFLALLLTVFMNFYQTTLNKPIDFRLVFLKDLVETTKLSDAKKFSKNIYICSNKDLFLNINDFAQYFFPDYKIHRAEYCVADKPGIYYIDSIYDQSTGFPEDNYVQAESNTFLRRILVK